MDKTLLVASAVVVLGAAVAVLVRCAGWVNHIVRRIQTFLDDWTGEPARPGVPRRLGVPERLAVIEGRLSRVESEMRPNGGSSLRDTVDRIEAVVTPSETP